MNKIIKFTYIRGLLDGLAQLHIGRHNLRLALHARDLRGRGQAARLLLPQQDQLLRQKGARLLVALLGRLLYLQLQPLFVALHLVPVTFQVALRRPQHLILLLQLLLTTLRAK